MLLAKKTVPPFVSNVSSLTLSVGAKTTHTCPGKMQGGVDSTQFKAKKTVFRQSEKSEGGQPVQASMDGWKCSTYQYLGSMQMKVGFETIESNNIQTLVLFPCFHCGWCTGTSKHKAGVARGV